MNDKPINLFPITVMAIVALVAFCIAAWLQPSTTRDVVVVLAGASAFSTIACIAFPSTKVRIG